MDHIGCEIKRRREKLGMSQVTLAARMRRSQATVSDWEAGKSTPHLLTLDLLAVQLKCTTAAIIKGAQKNKTKGQTK